MSRSGADLALLLLGGYRTLVESAVGELAARGHVEVRPVHDFAMRAIAAGADDARRIGAAELVVLEQQVAMLVGDAVIRPEEAGRAAHD